MFDSIKERSLKLLKYEPKARGSTKQEYFFDIPDTHSVAILASHLGRPIHTITVGKYQVFDKEPQVNGLPLERYKEAIRNAVDML